MATDFDAGGSRTRSCVASPALPTPTLIVMGVWVAIGEALESSAAFRERRFFLAPHSVLSSSSNSKVICHARLRDGRGRVCVGGGESNTFIEGSFVA